jgi:DNA-binding LytR/AlgR family response regulator
MKVLIIEDEIPAADKLETMLKEINSSIEIIGKLKSVKESLKWFKQNTNPDLVFVDVQLSDESSFELLKIIKPDFPMIFTTAYDEYVLKAFEYNSIDYLLKPYTKERLEKALHKMNSMEAVFLQKKINNLLTASNNFKTKFIVKKGPEYLTIKVEDIVCFYTEFKITFIKDILSNKYIMDNSLSEIMNEIDNNFFYRANRQNIVNRNYIEKYSTDAGKLILTLKFHKEEIVVSKETASDFRKWFKEESK